MKNLLIVAILALSLSSCKNETKNATNTVANAPTKISSLEMGCYAYNKDGNEILLNITSLNNGVVGKLNYALAGKDSNSGTFDGKCLMINLSASTILRQKAKKAKEKWLLC